MKTFELILLAGVAYLLLSKKVSAETPEPTQPASAPTLPPAITPVAITLTPPGGAKEQIIITDTRSAIPVINAALQGAKVDYDFGPAPAKSQVTTAKVDQYGKTATDYIIEKNKAAAAAKQAAEQVSKATYFYPKSLAF